MKDVRKIKKDINLANNRKEWRKLVDEAKNLLGFQEPQWVNEWVYERNHGTAVYHEQKLLFPYFYCQQGFCHNPSTADWAMRPSTLVFTSGKTMGLYSFPLSRLNSYIAFADISYLPARNYHTEFPVVTPRNGRHRSSALMPHPNLPEATELPRRNSTVSPAGASPINSPIPSTVTYPTVVVITSIPTPLEYSPGFILSLKRSIFAVASYREHSAISPPVLTLRRLIFSVGVRLYYGHIQRFINCVWHL